MSDLEVLVPRAKNIIHKTYKIELKKLLDPRKKSKTRHWVHFKVNNSQISAVFFNIFRGTTRCQGWISMGNRRQFAIKKSSTGIDSGGT